MLDWAQYTNVARLAAKCGGKFAPMVVGLTNEQLIERAACEVRDQRRNRGTRPHATLRVAEFRHQLEVDITGAFAVIKGFLPLLVTAR
jgi:hypothetical protein